MKIKIYNSKAEAIGEAKLKPELFGLEANHELIHQIAVAMQANQRKPWAHTKDRSEKRGGGRKPWRQKGTGRARHGSRRSPIWVGGGVTFGPRKEKIYSKKINKKAKKQALLMMLSSKYHDQELKIINKLTCKKTKDAQAILNNFKIKSVLVVQENKAFRNIPKTKTINPENLNVLDLLRYKHLIIPEKSIKKIEKIWLKKSKKKQKK